MKKILILTYEMFPYTNNWGGCQRVHYMANKLSETEDVTVIASENLIEKNSRIAKRQEYKTLFLSNKLHTKIYNSPNRYSAKASPKKHGVVSKVILAMSSIINRLFFNEPNQNIGIVAYLWMLLHTGEILSYIRNNQIEFVIVSIPPWNIIRISLLKKMRKSGCKIIIDYRDPWNCWNGRKGMPFFKERRILRLVDGVFVTNENHLERLMKDFSLNPNKLHVIMNGYDSMLWDSVKVNMTNRTNDYLVMSYVGAISFAHDSFRNPKLFLEALALFEHKDRIIFRVVGHYDEAIISEYNNTIPHFEMIPSVSQNESFVKMQESDILINFHTIEDESSKYLIAGKIFDYYRSGARLLSINGTESFERKFVQDHHLGYYSENKLQQLKSTIENIYQDWISCDKFCVRRKKYDLTYSRQFQNDKVLKVLYEL